MLNLIRNEAIKVFLGKKLYVLMLGILLANSLIGVESLVGSIEMPVNGQNVPIYMLPTIVNILMPLFIIVLVAGMVTDEYVSGTLKLTLIQPVSRRDFITAKLFALGTLIVYLLSFSLATSYLMGTIFFGWGEQFIYEGEFFQTATGVMVTVGSYFISSLPLMVFGSLVILVSLQFNSSGAAVGTSLGLLLIVAFLGEIMPVIRPFLFVNYFRQFAVLIFQTGDMPGAALGVLVMAGYGLGSYLVTVYLFNRKDLVC